MCGQVACATKLSSRIFMTQIASSTGCSPPRYPFMARRLLADRAARIPIRRETATEANLCSARKTRDAVGLT